MSFILLFTYTLIGLLSGAHCAGRCSGMIGAINSALRPYPDKKPIWLALTAGRLAGYTVGGGLAGSLGWLLLRLSPDFLHLQILLTLLAGLMLVLMGISIAGRPIVIAWTEIPGRRLWTILQPVWRRCLPPNTFQRAFRAGFLWGWLPCGLVYSVLLNAMASGSAVQGAVTMCAFGLGTMPNVLAVAWLSGRWRHHFQNSRIRLLSGLLIILAGIQQTVRVLMNPA